MKKTITAFLALAGLAVAAESTTPTGEDFNELVSLKLEEVGYTKGDAFNISATLSGLGNANKGFITLASNYYIVNQNHAYWGLNSVSSNNLTNNGQWTLSVSGNDYTYTSTSGKLPILWTQNDKGNGSATRNVGEKLTVSIASDGVDSTITLSYTSSSIIDTFILKGTVLDASAIKFADDIESVTNASVTVKPLPEPTTATLSLLALAGLAARRRRR
ncbi:MAG: hypothetical protein IKZ10_01245 [Akkermansia sp.]|nr:hypothetical protein [Akkermansia sp.]